MPLVEQELLALPKHLRSPPVFSGVRVTRSLVLDVCFVDRCLSFWPLCCLFFFDIRILITLLVSSNSSYEARRCLIFQSIWSLCRLLWTRSCFQKVIFLLVVVLSGSCFLSFVFHCSHLSIFVAQLILEIIIWNKNFQYIYVFSFLY